MKKILILILLCSVFTAFAQEQRAEEEHANFHRVTIVLGHAHVPEGIKANGNKQWLLMGSWGVDYDYWFQLRWAIGLHSDVIMENFEVEKSGEGEEAEGILERSYPLATALMGAFKPGEHLTLLLGTGGEFAKEETLFLIRAGLEYGWELPGEWELGLSLMNDFKVDAYDSWTLGVGISKILGKELEAGEE